MLVSKIAYNIIISTGARILGTVIALVNIGFITRYLGKDLFGEYVTILAFVYTFSVMADLGLYSLLVRDISRPGADERKIVGNIFTLRLVSLVIAFGVILGVGLLFPYSQQVKSGIIIGAFSFFFLSGSQALVGIFQKYLQIKWVALAEILGRTANLGLVILFVYLGYGFLWIIAALTLGSLVNFLTTFFCARKFVPISLRFDFVFWKKILKEAWPIAASIILTLMYFKLDTIILSIMKPAGHVGIYGVAYKVLESIIFFPAMLVGLIMPLLSQYAVSDKLKFKFIFQKTFDILLLIAIPIIAGIVFLASPIVFLIGGPEFKESAVVLQILAFAIGVIFLGSLFGNSIIALGRQGAAAWIYGAGAVGDIALNIIFIPKHSYIGAAMTTIFTEILVTILMAILIYKTVNFFPKMTVVFKAFLGAIVMYLILRLFAGFNLFFMVGLGMIVYFTVIYALGAVKRGDIAMLMNKTGK